MSIKSEFKPLAAAIGATLAASAFSLPIASADENPFQIQQLPSGYMVAGKDGNCGMKMMDSDSDGSISKSEFMQHKEEKFNKMDTNGDGVLTGDEMKMHKRGKSEEGRCGEGKCGEKGKDEGKCGEGKCGEKS
jgi:uncharacterized low-complexity protein